MADVKVFKCFRSNDIGARLADAVERSGVKVHQEPVDADVSIVLSGYFENPCILTGKKIVIVEVEEWLKPIPPPHGFNLMLPIIEEYYDEVVNVTGLSLNEKVERVKGIIERESRQPRNPD